MPNLEQSYLKVKQLYHNALSLSTKSNNIKFSIIAVIILIITGYLLYIRHKLGLNNNGSSSNCSLIQKLFPTRAALLSVVDNTSGLADHPLRDFTIKSAYNCCCSGQFKNDYVNLCALQNCISQGVRFLDFEIYSINDKPVVAASSVDSYTTKETYNSLSINSVFDVITQTAFSNGGCSNSNDPLILHFRISSNNVKMYNELANSISSMLNQYVLGPKYSNGFFGKNLGAEPIKKFREKIIIFVDSSNPTYKNTNLHEYVNMASGTPYLHLLRYNEIKFTQDLNITNFNKENMTIVLPDLNISNENPNFFIPYDYGCQMTCLSFQNNDSNLQAADNFFTDKTSAFALKPPELLPKPETIDKPPPLPEKYSYAPRRIQGEFYDYQI